MSALPSTILPRVSQLVRLLGSNHDGEVVATARALSRTLSGNGASFHDLADKIEREPAPRIIYVDRPQPHAANFRADALWTVEARTRVKVVLHRALARGILTVWECEFARSILLQMATSSSWRPSTRQQATINTITTKAAAAGVRA